MKNILFKILLVFAIYLPNWAFGTEEPTIREMLQKISPEANDDHLLDWVALTEQMYPIRVFLEQFIDQPLKKAFKEASNIEKYGQNASFLLMASYALVIPKMLEKMPGYQVHLYFLEDNSDPLKRINSFLIKIKDCAKSEIEDVAAEELNREIRNGNPEYKHLQFDSVAAFRELISSRPKIYSVEKYASLLAYFKIKSDWLLDNHAQNPRTVIFLRVNQAYLQANITKLQMNQTFYNLKTPPQSPGSSATDLTSLENQGTTSAGQETTPGHLSPLPDEEECEEENYPSF